MHLDKKIDKTAIINSRGKGELNNLSKEIYANNVTRGFYEEYEALKVLVNKEAPFLNPTFSSLFIASRLALIHSEISENLEANRIDKSANVEQFIEDFTRQPYNHSPKFGFTESFETHIKNTQEDEIADSIIRLLDLAAFIGMDVDFHVKTKMLYNSGRPFKHNKKY